MASNGILAAFPIVNEDNGSEWVSVLVYNKWMYNDHVRDSSLYQDLWKIQEGKIRYMISLEQKPSRPGFKQLESLTKD